MEFINNDDDNVGINPLINNNNNNNENNNENNNQINNNNENDNNNFISQYKDFTPSFIIIFLINLIIWAISFYSEIEKYKYVFEIDPIMDHSQYYRFITRYFIHFGICHLLLELYITYYLCKYFENTFGTLMTISFILISMVIDSIIHLFFGIVFSNICYTFKLIDNSIIHYEGGLTPVLFSLNTFYYLYDHENFDEYNIFVFLSGKGNYSSLTMLIILYFFTPNKTFIGNLSGICGAYFIKSIFFCFLPKINWIIDFEDVFNLKNNGQFYRYITTKNLLMKSVLNQIEPDTIRYLIENEKENEEKEKENNLNINQDNNNIENNQIHQSSIEMSSLSNNNNNNNN